MNTINSLLAIFSVITIAYSLLNEELFKDVDIQTEEDAKMHVFVLLVPETTVKALRNKLGRQEEEESQVVTQAGTYVAQILTGILGGDASTIFGGSFNFIGNTDVRTGVNTIFESVTPTVNIVLKQWVARAQMALGLTPTTPIPSKNQTVAAGGDIIVGRPISAAQASMLQSAQSVPKQTGK